jgi:hypothetical protein
MLYMVIERYRNGAGPVYERFRARGRMMPPGLDYVDSWVTADRARCYQLMRTEDPDLFPVWTSRWKDLVEFEVIPVISSAQAAALSAG